MPWAKMMGKLVAISPFHPYPRIFPTGAPFSHAPSRNYRGRREDVKASLVSPGHDLGPEGPLPIPTAPAPSLLEVDIGHTSFYKKLCAYNPHPSIKDSWMRLRQTSFEGYNLQFPTLFPFSYERTAFRGTKV